MTPFIQNATTFFSLATVAADILVVIVFICLVLAWAGDKNIKKFFSKLSAHILLIAFLVSLSAPLGSLFYSEIAHFAPCELCWWQRIFSYPIAIVFAVGLWYQKKRKNTNLDVFFNISLILALIGALIALYHSYGVLVDTSVLPACAAEGVSCAKLYFLEYGYVTIPTMSLTTFLLTICTILIYKVSQK
jgi:disulfide bond formation protein DsbB